MVTYSYSNTEPFEFMVIAMYSIMRLLAREIQGEEALCLRTVQS